MNEPRTTQVPALSPTGLVHGAWEATPGSATYQPCDLGQVTQVIIISFSSLSIHGII